jgi:hypothetical protein
LSFEFERFFVWAASALTCDDIDSSAYDVSDFNNVNNINNNNINNFNNINNVDFDDDDDDAKRDDVRGNRVKRSFMPFRSEKFMSKQVIKFFKVWI